MTRVYRNVPNGITWIERGSNVPVLALPDHGDPVWRWMTPDVSHLVYDDELHAVETETIDEERSRLRAALIEAVAESKIPAVSKSDVRKLIEEVCVK
jgi:hypothetical protein